MKFYCLSLFTICLLSSGVLAENIQPIYTLSVLGGNGSGQYEAGEVISLNADTAPSGQVFAYWAGDTENIVEIKNPSTSLLMPASTITVTAVFVDDPNPIIDISLNVQADTLKYGESLQLDLSITPFDATNQHINWSSDNPELVSIDDNGLIKVKYPDDELLIFSDNFDDTSSYYPQITQNATCKEYTSCELNGHLLKKWLYNWEYNFDADWRQAFYCVPEFQRYMAQNGRAACALQDMRIIAHKEIPENTAKYVVTFKQFKGDNDPWYYFFGADRQGYNGIELGYQNQIPGTDETVPDAHILGDVNSGSVVRDAIRRGNWQDVRIIVDVKQKQITWYIDDRLILSETVPELKGGGYFGMRNCYDRGTRIDDVNIIGEGFLNPPPNQALITAKTNNGKEATVIITLLPQYAISTQITGRGMISLDPEQTSYDSGTVVKATATPETGWRFEGWGGDLSEIHNPVDFSIVDNMVLTANFSEIPPGSGFQYFRFTCTATNDDQLFLEAIDIMTEDTAYRLSDSWQVSGMPTTVHKSLDAEQQIVATDLRFTLGENTLQAPRDYTLEGSYDNSNWIVLLQESDLSSDVWISQGVRTVPFEVVLSGPDANGQEQLLDNLVFPNPTSAFLIIKALKRNEQPEIYTLSGQKVTNFRFQDSKADLTHLPSGIYVLKVNNQAIRFLKK